MEKTTFLLNPGQNELSFVLKSKLDQFSALNFLGLYLRSPRESRKRQGRLPPLDPSKPCVITVKRTNIQALPDPNFPIICEGHILTHKGLTTRIFPFEVKNSEQTLLNLGKPGVLHYELTTLKQDYYLFDILADGRVVRLQFEHVDENLVSLHLKLQIPPLQSRLEIPIRREEQAILVNKEELPQNEPMEIEAEDKENFLGSDFRALPSTNISAEAQRAQEELEQQLGKLKSDFSTMESSKNIEIQTLKATLADKDKRIHELETKVDKMAKDMEKMREEFTQLKARHHRTRSRSSHYSRLPTHVRKNYRSPSRSKHPKNRREKYKEKDKDKEKEREREREKNENEKEKKKAKERERERELQRQKEMERQQRLEQISGIRNGELSSYVVDEFLSLWNKNVSGAEKHREIKISKTSFFSDLTKGKIEPDMNLFCFKYIVSPITYTDPNKVNRWGLSIVINPGLVPLKTPTSTSVAKGQGQEEFKAFYLDSSGITMLKPVSDLIATYLIALKKKGRNDSSIAVDSGGYLTIKTEFHHQWLEEKFISSPKESKTDDSGIMMLNSLVNFLSNPQRFIFESNTAKGFGRKPFSIQEKREEYYKFLVSQSSSRSN